MLRDVDLKSSSDYIPNIGQVISIFLSSQEMNISEWNRISCLLLNIMPKVEQKSKLKNIFYTDSFRYGSLSIMAPEKNMALGIKKGSFSQCDSIYYTRLQFESFYLNLIYRLKEEGTIDFNYDFVGLLKALNKYRFQLKVQSTVLKDEERNKCYFVLSKIKQYLNSSIHNISNVNSVITFTKGGNYSIKFKAHYIIDNIYNSQAFYCETDEIYYNIDTDFHKINANKGINVEVLHFLNQEKIEFNITQYENETSRINKLKVSAEEFNKLRKSL